MDRVVKCSRANDKVPLGYIAHKYNLSDRHINQAVDGGGGATGLSDAKNEHPMHLVTAVLNTLLIAADDITEVDIETILDNFNHNLHMLNITPCS